MEDRIILHREEVEAKSEWQAKVKVCRNFGRTPKTMKVDAVHLEGNKYVVIIFL